MGQRSSFETTIAIITALWRQRTWSQSELARECGVSVRALRSHLDEMTTKGWPLEREEDHPHVYWSVQSNWFPNGLLLDPPTIASLLTVLMHVPASEARTQVLRAVIGHAPAPVVDVLSRVIHPRSSEVEERYLPKLRDALAQAVPLRFRYWTASRGVFSDRTVSVQRVLVGPPIRFVAHCHSAGELRWFRLDNAADPTLDRDTKYHSIDDTEIDALLDASIDGFHGDERIRVSFFVRDPEARWVANNLPEGLDGAHVEGGLLIEAETAGLEPIARFVVGLGAAAECRTPELAARVRELAQGALQRADQE